MNRAEATTVAFFAITAVFVLFALHEFRKGPK